MFDSNNAYDTLNFGASDLLYEEYDYVEERTTSNHLLPTGFEPQNERYQDETQTIAYEGTEAPETAYVPDFHEVHQVAGIGWEISSSNLANTTGLENCNINTEPLLNQNLILDLESPFPFNSRLAISRVTRLQCPRCQRTFVDPARLDWHVKREHRSVFQCRDCHVCCRTARELARHKRSVHQRTLSFHSKCGDMTTFRRDNLLRHERRCPRCLIV